MKSSACLVVALAVLGCAGDPAISNVDDGKGAGGGSSAGSGGTGGATRGGGGSGGSSGTTGGGNFMPPPVGPDGGASAAGPGGSNPDDKNCGLQTFKLQQRPAELMLVLDRSGSMTMPAGPQSMTSKWTDVTGALNDTIMMTQAAVQWGLKTFPTGDVMCGVNDGVEVPSAPMNYTAVWGGIQANAPGGNGGGTPTTIAINKAVAYLKATPSMNPRYLVLATDGEPNCAMGGITGGGGGRRGGGGGFGAADDAAAIMAVANAQAAGFKTFVIGVATGADAENVLTGMAMAGGEPRMGTPPYYPVANKMDLVNALGVITGLVTDCVFRLSPPPPSPMDVAVNVGNSRVSRDTTHMNGWDYGAANSNIQFYGPACDAVKKAAGQNVQIIFGCPGVLIP